jgi:hypothetical protein
MPRTWIPGVSKDTRKRPGDRHRPDRYRGFFVAIDGEGWSGSDDPTHRLRTMNWASATGEPHTLYEPQGISDKAAFDFILSIPAHATIIGFGLGYDKTMWTKDIDDETLDQLIRRREDRAYVSDGHVRYRPVEWGDYELEWLNTCFKVRRKGTKQFRTVWDVWPMYQGSFLKVIRTWCHDLTPEELRIVDEGKKGRNDIDKDPDEQMHYSHVECQLLAKVHTRFRQVLLDNGIKMRSWYGGSVAGAMLDLHKMQKHLPARQRIIETAPKPHYVYQYEEEPEIIRQGIDYAAYFGGRFENSVHGPVRQPVHEYDMKSAYPTALLDVPSLREVRYEHCTNRRKILNHPGWFLARVSYKMPDDHLWGAFPLRTATALTFPTMGDGRWVWSPEVRSMATALPKNLRVHEAWLLHDDGQRPFSFVRDYYDLRRELDSVWDGQGSPIKVGLNSLYGKCAQRGDAPRYQCLTWAGMITSHCRARLLDYLLTQPDNIVATATDALYSLERIPELEGHAGNLGDWGHHEYPDGFFFVKAGQTISYDPEQRSRTRGVTNRNFQDALPVFEREWSEYGTRTVVPVPQTRFCGARLGLRLPDRRGVWYEHVAKITMSELPKRRLPFMQGGLTRSLPTMSTLGEDWSDLTGEERDELVDKYDEIEWLVQG